jgi:hypothetical protein
MGKSTINGQFSMAMLNYQRVTAIHKALVGGGMTFLEGFLWNSEN